MITSNLWYYRYPGNFYAAGPMRFERPVTEREARRYLREEIECCARLPRGTELWPTCQATLDMIARGG